MLRILPQDYKNSATTHKLSTTKLIPEMKKPSAYCGGFAGS